MKAIPLADVCVGIRNGLSVRQSPEFGGLPITRIETISNGCVDPTRVGYAGLTESSCAGWLLAPGDILFSHINSTEHLGKVAMYEGMPSRLVHGMNLLAIRPDTGTMIPRYLLHVLRSKDFRRALRRHTKPAVNQASITISDLKTILLPVPSIEEQKRIAAILDAADTLREKRRLVISALNQFRLSIFIRIFGDPRVDRRWPRVALKEVGEIVTGRTPPAGLPNAFDGPVPFATPSDLDESLAGTQRTLSESGARASRTVRAGSALVCCIGNVGKMARTPVTTAFNQQINAVEWAERIDDTYGIDVLRFFANEMITRAASTTLPILNKTKFGAIQIPVPPLALQNEYSQETARVDALSALVTRAYSAAHALCESVNSRAFTGEL